MRTYLRHVALVSTAVIALSGGVAAQENVSPTLSNREVQELITRGTPADHARLAQHFSAVADRYAADAQRHAAMQPAFKNNPKLAHMVPSQIEHCRQLALRNEESASLLRELAAHHRKQTEGVASVPPRGSERFEGTTPTPSDAELTRLAATAATPADHQSLARYFTTIADRYAKDAADSAAYASTWQRLTRNPSSGALAERWNRLAQQQTDASREARAAATLHQQQAATAK